MPAAPEAPVIPDVAETKEADPNTAKVLEGLNRAVEYYTRALSSRVPQDEEEQKTFKPVPPLTDLEQLVTYRVIRAVPAAPAGKKYVFDAQTGTAKLVNQ